MNKEIKFLKNKNNQIICIILIIGVVLMLISNGGEKKTEETTPALPNEETRLAEILSEIDGAGEVSVMITYYGTAEKDIAYETKTNTVGQESHSEESEDKKAVMSGDEPVVIREIYPKAKGIIVAADGGGDPAVRQAISKAVTAVTDVPAHRVKVYKREQK